MGPRAWIAAVSVYVFVLFSRTNGQNPLCDLPRGTVFSWSNPLTWPLNNDTFNEPPGIGGRFMETTANATRGSISEWLVRKHNCLRSLVPRDGRPASNMLMMQWNTEAYRKALHWAEQCTYEHNEAEARRTSQFRCGQNIAMSAGSPVEVALFSWNRMMNIFYNEINDYTYNDTKNNEGKLVYHYTAIAWAKSWQVGCAWKNCSRNLPGSGGKNGTWYYYVCHYCPSGNIQGQLPYKRGVPCSDCPGKCNGGRLCTNICTFSNQFSNCDQLEKEHKICKDPTFSVTKGCQATCNCGCPGKNCSIY